VSATVEQPTSRVSSSGIRWIRVVVAGILLEFALVAVLVPIGGIFGAPPGLGRNQTGSYAVFLTAVPVGCLVLGYLAGWWLYAGSQLILSHMDSSSVSSPRRST